jgi:hypothetical protein
LRLQILTALCDACDIVLRAFMRRSPRSRQDSAMSLRGELRHPTVLPRVARSGTLRMTELINRKIDVDKRSDARCSADSAEATSTPKQRAVLERYLKRRDSRPDAPRLSVKSKPNQPLEVSHPSLADGAGLALAFGTTEGGVASILLNSLINAACDGTSSNPPSEQDVNGVFAAVHGIGANDEIEAMLAVQMVATHFAATRALRRLKGSDMVSQQDSNGNLAVKLLRQARDPMPVASGRR